MIINQLEHYKDDMDKWLESIQSNINEIIQEVKTSTKKNEKELFTKIRSQYHLINLILKIKSGKVQIKGFNHKLIKKQQ